MKKRIISILLIFLLAMSFTACGNEPGKGQDVSEEIPEKEEIGNTYTAGTYTGSAQGFGGIIVADVTVDENKITDVKLKGESESAGIGTNAIENLPAKIVESNSADVDAITGATYSSNGVLEAVKEALSMAKGEVQAAKVLKDGKYIVDVIGHEGKVTVGTMFLDGSIKSIEVLAHNETKGIGSFAVTKIPPKIVESQSINVDAVTGATITSNVIKQAVTQAITLAGGNVAEFNKEIAKPEIVKKDVKEDVQVVIMGAGTAGLFAAAQLQEKGITDILLFEKQEIPGGCMPTTYGGLVLSDSEIFNNWGLGNPLYSSWDNIKATYTAILDATGVEYNKELPFTKIMFTKAGEMYDWMSNIGIGFNTLGSRSGYSYPYFAPGCYQGGSGTAMEFLVNRIVSKGARIIYETPVTDLIQDETGRIKGLIAEGKDGTTWTVNADAVLLASGSFAKNQELINQYFPEWSGHFFNTIESVTGDGLVLGMRYGAGIEDMGSHVPGFLASYDSHFELAFMHLTTPGIIVSINGNQFGNIMKDNHSTMSKAKADPANGDTFYYIFDEAAAVQTRKNEAYGFDAYKAIFEKGEAKHYDTIEDCATKLNLPGLVDTVKKNNELSLAGEEDEWGRSKLPYIETNTGIWAIRVDPNVYLTTGGLMINTSSQVLTEDKDIIPGLYAAGDVCGSIEQKDGRNYGYGFDSAMSMGVVAAETIANKIK